ncbi:MAG TPA: hypothetical protein DD738_04550 [Ruminiclostridium sp.]|nr:hypothetical protein [Ruminiclostridium sp.]
MMAIIPSILWLTIFYRQDRMNPEPKSYVLKILVLGALVQRALYMPLMKFIFPDGSSRAIAGNYAVTIILVAVIQESIKLLSVRYSIYSSDEFDENVDGIIYGSALGLGFASMSSMDLILANNGAMLTNVTALVVIETFAHASITGLSCYVLGVSKREKLSLVRLPAAVIIASALNAVTQFLLDAVIRDGFEVNYIIGLIPAALVALLVFSILVVLSSRPENNTSDIIEPRKAFAGIFPVWAILAAALITGFITGHISQAMTAHNVDNTIEIMYPSGWVRIEDEENIFKAGNIIKSGEQEFVSVKKLPLDSLCSVETHSQEETLQNAAAAWSIKSGMNYRFYQSEKGYYLNTKGKETYVIDYLYIDGGSGSGSLPEPSIGYGRDVISIEGEYLYITTISASYKDYVLDHKVLSEVQYTFVND